MDVTEDNLLWNTDDDSEGEAEANPPDSDCDPYDKNVKKTEYRCQVLWLKGWS